MGFQLATAVSPGSSSFPSGCTDAVLDQMRISASLSHVRSPIHTRLADVVGIDVIAAAGLLPGKLKFRSRLPAPPGFENIIPLSWQRKKSDIYQYVREHPLPVTASVARSASRDSTASTDSSDSSFYSPPSPPSLPHESIPLNRMQEAPFLLESERKGLYSLFD